MARAPTSPWARITWRRASCATCLGHDNVAITIRSEIPVARGLGSSAALAAATAAAAGAPDPLAIATRVDGHAENAAASVLGGLVVGTVVDGAAVAAQLRTRRPARVRGRGSRSHAVDARRTRRVARRSAAARRRGQPRPARLAHRRLRRRRPLLARTRCRTRCISRTASRCFPSPRRSCAASSKPAPSGRAGRVRARRCSPSTMRGDADAVCAAGADLLHATDSRRARAATRARPNRPRGH